MKGNNDVKMLRNGQRRAGEMQMGDRGMGRQREIKERRRESESDREEEIERKREREGEDGKKKAEKRRIPIQTGPRTSKSMLFIRNRLPQMCRSGGTKIEGTIAANLWNRQSSLDQITQFFKIHSAIDGKETWKLLRVIYIYKTKYMDTLNVQTCRRMRNNTKKFIGIGKMGERS